MTKVSVVIPVYNMEKYLDRAYNSLKNQTMADFEAIFVNDGSADGSGEILSHLEKEDERVRVITKVNGGVASARNTALDAAKGEYVFFLDPDDWIEPDTFSSLTTAADRETADIVMFGVMSEFFDNDGNTVKRTVTHTPMEGVFRGEPFKKYFDRLATNYLVATKMIRREFIEKHGCRFHLKNIGEDGLFYVSVYENDPECLVMIDRPFYHYFVARSSSLSNSYHPERVNDNFYLSEAVRSAVEKWGLMNSPMHLKTAYYATVRDLQIGIKNVSLGNEPIKKRRLWLKNVMKDEWVKKSVKSVSVSMAGNRNDKIKLILIKLHLYFAVMALSGINQKK